MPNADYLYVSYATGLRFPGFFNYFNNQVQRFTSDVMRVPVSITLVVLCSLIQHTTYSCNVTCTTDYISSLTCSCTGPKLASYVIKAQCGDPDENDGSIVSCEINVPERWCKLELDPEETPIDPLSECTVEALSAHGEPGEEPNNSTTLKLFENIKPQPPFNVSLTMISNSSYKVSWETAYDEDSKLTGHLMYRVRIRVSGEEKPNYHYVYEDKRYLEIPSRVLHDGTEYDLDVQVKVSPHRIETSFWSDWSPSACWKTKFIPDKEDSGKDYMQYCFLFLIAAPCLLCFFVTRRQWQKKVHVYIPSPEVFFRPLYHSYGGDFRKWVGPTFTFSQSDWWEGSTAVSLEQGKRGRSVESLGEGQRADDSCTSSSPFLGSAHSSDPGPGLDGSAGHISIATVTVLEDGSQSSGGSGAPQEECFTYPPLCLTGSAGSEALGLLPTGGVWDGVISGGRMSGGARTSEGPSNHPLLDCLAPHPHRDGDVGELDQSSLESFSFNEHSDDGYPPVTLDMDTIDSGFLESDCSSPVRSEPGVPETTDPSMLAVSFHTNYVKQWVASTEPSAPQGAPQC
ncbi:hypothetical protein GJAV_G00260050 [Gymnothorax javanicus]|nr:hypothetical protein GJAV_G00260050 [Gymnothorax javanicus]